MLHSLMELLGQHGTGNGPDRTFLPAVLGAFRRKLPQHHLRVVQEVAVDGQPILRLSQVKPVWLRHDSPLTLLEKENVRDHLGSRIGEKRIVRETNGPQQLRPLGKVLPHLGTLAVHGVPAGNKGHHAAGTHLIQRLGEKIIVDAEAQRIIAFVVHLIVAKGYVADGKVVEIPTVCSFKARHGNVRIGIELLCKPTGNAVQLHTVQPGSGHMLRQQPKEIAHPAGRLQDIAGGKAHASNGFIDTPNHRGAGVVGVEHRFPCRLVFLVLQQFFQLGMFTAPGGVFGIKGLGHSAPAHIAG